jgi:osmoprotectant transport system substrate-binding protein
MRRRVALIAALVLVAIAGGVAALVAGGGSPTQPPTTAVTTAATTGTTVTQPRVTIDEATTTTPAQDLPGYGRPAIKLGDMNTPEQFVLGAMYSVALSQEGYSVNSPNRNIGATSVSQEALKQHVLDIYPQYLNAWDRVIANVGQRFKTLADAYAAGSEYAQDHGFELLQPTPGSDTTGFAVTKQFARENDVHSLADLAKAPLLTFGIPINFGGLWRAEKAYGFKAGVVQSVDTGTQYESLAAGSVQVAWVDTTDPQLAGPNFTLLSDPKHVYGFGNIVPVTTPATVKAEGPAFVATINRVDALLTTRALQGLNDEAMHSDPTRVAEEFLEGNGILPPDRYSVAG